MSAILTILLVIVAAAAVILFVRREQHHRDQIGQVRAEFERRIRELREEQTAQVERLERERDRIERTAHLELAGDLLDALDDFDNVLGEQEIEEDLGEGLEMIRRKLIGTLRSHGVERIEPAEADDFDPERHEALRAVDPEDAEPGTVVACHRPGYRFEERTLRPAAVDVAVGRDAQRASDDDAPSAADRNETVDQETVDQQAVDQKAIDEQAVDEETTPSG